MFNAAPALSPDRRHQALPTMATPELYVLVIGADAVGGAGSRRLPNPTR